MRGERAADRVRRAYLMPAALAVGIALGLGSALLGDGIFDALSWLAAALPSR
jgi:hypothetical protein